jgi:hypothetical protein
VASCLKFLDLVIAIVTGFAHQAKMSQLIADRMAQQVRDGGADK